MSRGTEMEPIPAQKHQPAQVPWVVVEGGLGQDLGFEVPMIPSESGGWL